MFKARRGQFRRYSFRTKLLACLVPLALCLLSLQVYTGRKYHEIEGGVQQQVGGLGEEFQSLPRRTAMWDRETVVQEQGPCWCNCSGVFQEYNTNGKLRIGALTQEGMSVQDRSQRKMGMDQIYVVNLEWRLHRRLYMDALFKYINIEGIVWPAVTMQDPFVVDYWPSFNESVKEKRKKKNAPLIMTSPGEVACWQSHLSIWKDIQQNEYDMALILEDDVDIVADLAQRVEEILSIVPEQWDVVWLGSCAEDVKKKKFLGSDVYEANHPYCSHAYMLHGSKTASKLIDALGTHIQAPIDEEIRLFMMRRRRREKDFLGYSIIPTISEQLPRDSIHNPSDVRFTTIEIPREPVTNSARVQLVKAVLNQQKQTCDIPIMLYGLNMTQVQQDS